MLRSLPAVCLAVLVSLPASAQTGPTGVSGMLADFSSKFVIAQTQYGASIIAQTLESAMKRSRNLARTDAQPMPDEIREALAPYYSQTLLDDVRYKVGDTSPDGLAGFAIRNGNAAAVTLIDTIIFKDEKYVRNLALWAHEMHHVQQYAEWGVSGFASRYAFGWEAVESEARARADDFVNWYRDRTAANQ